MDSPFNFKLSHAVKERISRGNEAVQVCGRHRSLVDSCAAARLLERVTAKRHTWNTGICHAAQWYSVPYLFCSELQSLHRAPPARHTTKLCKDNSTFQGTGQTEPFRYWRPRVMAPGESHTPAQVSTHLPWTWLRCCPGARHGYRRPVIDPTSTVIKNVMCIAF